MQDDSIRSYKGIKPQLSERVYVDSTSVLVGDIRIGDDSSIWPLVAARGDVNHIHIGDRKKLLVSQYLSR